MALLAIILKFVNNKFEISSSLNKIHPHISEAFQECCGLIFDPNKGYEESFFYKINYILNYLHDHLNTGIWSEVPEYKRQAFTAVSFVKSLIILKSADNVINMQEALKCIDKGFLLGLPLKDNFNLLTQCASCISKEIEQHIGTKCHTQENNEEIPNKRMKFNSNNKYDDLLGKEIDRVKVPPLEEFYKSYFLSEKPAVIQGCMSHWPACLKWLDIKYLLRTAGERTVPIEIGSSYSDENFSSKLMTVREFVSTYYTEDSKDIGYLAQHDLLNQVPELKADIRIPEYCCTSRNFDDDNLFEPEINAWFGPKGTVSSLHHDPKDNLLCQVFGTKQVILFAPFDSEYLYAHEETLLSNTAQVDPIIPDLIKFPEFAKASMYKCLLKPGEMLYMPPKWWHHITALEQSFSVNFWWQ